MQDLPEKTALLEALAKFLDQDARPAIKDPALAFRMRIAAHLATVVAREIRAEDQHDLAELERLEQLEDVGSGRRDLPATRAERRERILSLNTKLARALRSGRIPAGAHQHLKTTLLEKLSVLQPKFDTSNNLD